MYITSYDDHNVHDVLMVTYIVSNLPWMLGGIACTPVHNTAARRKRWVLFCGEKRASMLTEFEQESDSNYVCDHH